MRTLLSWMVIGVGNMTRFALQRLAVMTLTVLAAVGHAKQIDFGEGASAQTVLSH